ncbi:ATP-binding protein [Frankia sp. AiPs1]|uniref:HelD family protein n=1 Tax=Frankia sp. AiPs1 TaxID=573493 RepID=UPI0035AC253C
MRAEAEGTQVAGGDPVDDKVTIEFLRIARKRRIAGLADGEGTAPLFFARLDYALDAREARDGSGGSEERGISGAPGASGTCEAAGAAEAAGHRFYLGRRHVRESAGDDPLVVDWRTDVARPFYRAHRGDPMGVLRRRRFGYDGPELTAFEDEPLTGPAATPVAVATGASVPPGAAVGSDEAVAGFVGTVAGPVDAAAGIAPGTAPAAGGLLEREIERPRSGPMRDIVATIQPEQDEIVRADLAVSVCVQGAPGTGKTAVGLHRAAYLLFTHRERLARAGVLVVGPNRAFLGYIAAVLPALGEFTVRHSTLADLLDDVTAAGTDTIDAASLKGDVRMATVLRRALHDGLYPPTGPVTVVTRIGRWTVGEEEFAGLFADAAGGLAAGTFRYAIGRERLAGRLANALRVRAEAGGHYLTDGAVRTLARSRAVQGTVEAAWPKADAATLVRRLLTDPHLLARAADGILDADEQRTLLAAAPPGGARTARWSPADVFCIDEARDLIDGTVGFGHLIVDEAQDLSPMQCRALARRCADGSLTVLGDLAQGTTPWAATSWSAQLTHLGRPDAHLEVLTRGYRVPAEILGFAGRLLPHIAAELAVPTSARTTPGALTLLPTADVAATVTAQVARARAATGSFAVIAADADLPALAEALRAADLAVDELGADSTPSRACLVPASLAKGLEFDQVIAVEPATIIAGEPHPRLGLRRLYVVLTRAVSDLTVIHADPLPAALRSPAPVPSAPVPSAPVPSAPLPEADRDLGAIPGGRRPAHRMVDRIGP